MDGRRGGGVGTNRGRVGPTSNTYGSQRYGASSSTNVGGSSSTTRPQQQQTYRNYQSGGEQQQQQRVAAPIIHTDFGSKHLQSFFSKIFILRLRLILRFHQNMKI